MEKATEPFFVKDDSGEAQIYVQIQTKIDLSEVARGEEISVIGIVSQYKEYRQIRPRMQDDIIIGKEETKKETKEEPEKKTE